MRNPQTLWLLPLLGAITSCTFSGDRTSTVRIAADSLPTRTANGRLSYDCYAVSVTGPGVSPTASTDELGSYKAECLGWGVYSNLLSADEITRGVKLSLPAGVQRKITVYGVVTRALGSACAGQPATALFKNFAVPELYPLAVAESVDLLKDTKVALKRTTTAGEEMNMLNACFPTTPPGDVPPSAIKAVKIAALFSDTNGMQLLGLDLATGMLTVEQSLPLSLPQNSQIYASPDSKRVLAWEGTFGAHQQYLYTADALASRGDSLSTTSLTQKYDVAFSPTGEHALVYADSSVGFLTSASGAQYENNVPPTDLSTGLGTFAFARGDFLYKFTSGKGTILGFTAFQPAWSMAPLFALTGYSVPGSEASKKSIVTSKGMYFAHFVNSRLYIQYLEFLPDGKLNLIGGPAEVAAPGASVSEFDLALAPNERYLIVKSGTGTATISTYPLLANGAVDTTAVAGTTAVSYYVGMLMEPSARYLLVAWQPGGLSSNIDVFSITSAGTFQLKSSLISPTIPGFIQGMAPLSSR